MSQSKQGRWVVRLGVGLAVAGLCGFGIFWLMLSSWSNLADAGPVEAQAAFDEALALSGGGPPYVEIPATGPVRVHRELERQGASVLKKLHLVAWEPRGRHLLRIDFPFWFVRLKMTRSINLGTLTTALSGDWQHLDLRVSEEDLERRGPALILHRVRGDGSRLLLWTE